MEEELTPAQKFSKEWSEAFNELSLEDQEKVSKALTTLAEVDWKHFHYKFRNSGLKHIATLCASIYENNLERKEDERS